MFVLSYLKGGFMKKSVLIVICILFVAIFSGCETMKGIGKDLQNTGDNIWEAVTNK